MDNKLILFINTVKYLKPSQVVYRVFNRLKRKMYRYKILKINILSKFDVNIQNDFLIPGLDFEKEYLTRFDLNGVIKNEFEFINIKQKVCLNKTWNDQSLQHLWRYNLHYFEYLYKLAFCYKKERVEYYDKYKELIQAWIKNNPFPNGDGWHSYTISLRITNWISTYKVFIKEIDGDSEFKKEMLNSLYLQYNYLQYNLEKDVLGNHYFENIKALIIGSLFFAEDNVKKKFIKELKKQLNEQILSDGMHFELSPMYHKIVLEDLIKITVWLKKEVVYKNLIVYIQKMIDVMYSLEDEFGKTPSFNDSTDGISKNYKCLLRTCKKEFGLKPKYIDTLEDSGYYILKNNQFKLLFDCGDICPLYLPPHGHCDALSYELSVKGIPILINSGTYQYESGKWRNYFRKTKAHNTVTVGDREQSQCWGSFRVAKRINQVKRKRFSYKGVNFISGTYKTYFGVKHTRYIGAIEENILLVLDKIEENIEDEIKSYIHINPNMNLAFTENIRIEKDNNFLELIPISVKDVHVSKGWYSKSFNLKDKNNHIVLTKKSEENFFGYLICLNNVQCKLEIINDELTIMSNKKFIINFNKLGEKA